MIYSLAVRCISTEQQKSFIFQYTYLHWEWLDLTTLDNLTILLDSPHTLFFWQNFAVVADIPDLNSPGINTFGRFCETRISCMYFKYQLCVIMIPISSYYPVYCWLTNETVIFSWAVVPFNSASPCLTFGCTLHCDQMITKDHWNELPLYKCTEILHLHQVYYNVYGTVW